jgi:chitinase
MRYVLPLSLLLAISSVYARGGPYCALAPPKAVARGLQGGGGNSSSNSGSEDVVAASWYPGWHGTQFPPSNITWSGYNDVKYAFALRHCPFLINETTNLTFLCRVTTPDSSMVSLAPSDQQLLPQFVSAAHENVSGM